MIGLALFCDANGDQRVKATDVGGVRGLIGQSVIQSILHTRSDVDDDGDIDDTDLDLVRGEVGKDARYIPNPSCP